MPRHNRRRTDAASREATPAATVGERRDEWRGEVYIVRGVTGHGASKEYRCPGCDQIIRVGQPHLVVWPEFDTEAADRRHWHQACWLARDRRAPGRSRPPRH